MHILFVTTAHNSLSQRLSIELTERGHSIAVCLATSAERVIEAAERAAPGPGGCADAEEHRSRAGVARVRVFYRATRVSKATAGRRRSIGPLAAGSTSGA